MLAAKCCMQFQLQACESPFLYNSIGMHGIYINYDSYLLYIYLCAISCIAKLPIRVAKAMYG